MALSVEEQKFVSSIHKKITQFNIPVTFKQAVSRISGNFVETKYNNGRKEIVDAEVERFLIYNSVNYFIRKYGIIAIQGLGFVPFNLYYFQEKSLEDIQNKRFNVVLKTRQAGFSTLTSLYALWLILKEDQLETIDVISVSEKKAKVFKDRTQETITNLPLFIFPRVKDKLSGEYRYIKSLNELPTSNMTELRMPNGSVIKCETASENAGRGDSISLLVLDEAAHFKDNLIEKIWASAFPTLTKTKGSAIIISTPNGMNWYHQRWNNSKNGNSEFNPILIDWWEIPEVEKGNQLWLSELISQDYWNNDDIRNIGVEKARYEEVNWKENKWLSEQRKEMGEVLYKQEILHDFIVTGDTIFSTERLAQIFNKVEANRPKLKDILPNGENLIGLLIWKMPQKGKKYIITVDTSKGTGKDLSCIEVFDPVEYEQVAEYRNYISTKRFGDIIKKVGRAYNSSFVVIECNGIGESVFNEVYKHETDPYDNVYKTFITRKGSTSKIVTGWTTTPSLRKLITDEWINWISDDLLFHKLKLYSRRLYDEMCTWIWTDRGPDHPKSATDDCIMSMAIAIYCRNKSNSNDGMMISSTAAEYNISFETDPREALELEYQIAEEEDYSEEELKEVKKKDPYFDKYNVGIKDYKWMLGI